MSFMTMASGAIWYLDGQPNAPYPNMWTDIAVHLSKVCRFNGAFPGTRFYSVAQHCCNVCDLLKVKHGSDDKVLLHGLLHDVHEAFVSDLITPVKATMPPAAKTWWKELTDGLDANCFEAAGLDITTHSSDELQAVKSADMEMLVHEANGLLSYSDWTRDIIKDIPAAHLHDRNTILGATDLKPWAIEIAFAEWLARLAKHSQIFNLQTEAS